MSKAKELITLTETDDVPANGPSQLPPDAVLTGDEDEAKSKKPNTNFPDKPEVDKAIKEIAKELAEEVEGKIADYMSGHGELLSLLDSDEDEEHMAYNDIKLMIASILQGENIGEKALSSKQRKALSDSDFVFPKERKYPIPDIAHARNALARVAQNGTPAQQAKVKAAVHKKYPSLKK